MLNWHKTCTLKLENVEATLSYIEKNTSDTYTLKCTQMAQSRISKSPL